MRPAVAETLDDFLIQWNSWKYMQCLTVSTYSQEEIMDLEEENAGAFKSWMAHRNAEAAIIDGLNSEIFNSAYKFVNESRIGYKIGRTFFMWMEFTVLNIEDNIRSSVFERMR